VHDWVLDILACPLAACGGRLTVREVQASRKDRVRDGVLGCRACGAVFPVVGGVPIVVPDPSAWAARYYDAALAALAEANRASRQAVDLIELFAEASPGVDPMRFGDDWVPDEAAGFDPDAVPGDRPASELFRAFAAAADGDDPVRVLGDMLGGSAASLGTTVELGTGAGFLARALRARADRVLATDLSLRAAFRAQHYAGKGAGAPVAVAVVDADALCLHRSKVDTAAAANLVDLLDDPLFFFESLAHGLKKRGRLALATPDPSLGTDDDARLDRLLDAAGYRIHAVADGVPWLRAHGGRHVQVYFARIVLARPR